MGKVLEKFEIWIEKMIDYFNNKYKKTLKKEFPLLNDLIIAVESISKIPDNLFDLFPEDQWIYRLYRVGIIEDYE